MASELMARDATAWTQFVRDFDGAYKSFTDNRAALVSLGPYIQSKHPELLTQYRSLLERANELAPKLQSLADTRAKVTGWLTSIGNVYQSAVDATSRAIERAADWVGSARRALGLGELGIAPVVVVIGVAAAGATLTLITRWVADTYLFAKRLNAMQELEAKGYSASDAATAVNRVMGDPDKPGGIERTVSSILWLVALFGVGWYVLPRLFDSSAPSRSR